MSRPCPLPKDYSLEQQEQQQQTEQEQHATSSSSTITAARGVNRQMSQQEEEKEPQAPNCSPCMQLLKQVLSDPTSRPHILIQNLYNKHSISSRNTTTNNNKPQQQQQRPLSMISSTSTPETMHVAIPTQPTTTTTATLSVPHRSWEEVAQPYLQSATETVTATLLKHKTAMATSAATDQRSSSSSSSIPPQEWMEVSCKQCSQTGAEGGARAFVMGPHPLSIVVCRNRLQHTPPHDETAKKESSWFSSSSSNTIPSSSPSTEMTARRHSPKAVAEMEEILTHELVHVYDVRTLRLNLRDCENLAYSEVRAAREAECGSLQQTTTKSSQPEQQNPQHKPSSLFRGGVSAAAAWYNNKQSQQQNSQLDPFLSSCVQRKALLATQNMFPSYQAKQCVQTVFPAAMQDQRPFVYPTTATPSSPAQPPSSSDR